MFDSILKQQALPKPKYGLGLCIALSLHVAALFWVLGLHPQHTGSTNPEMDVILYKSLPPMAPPLLEPEHAPPPPPLPKADARPPKWQQTPPKPLAKPAKVPAEKPFEAAPHALLEEKGEPTHPYSEEYGEEGGNADSHFNPALHGKPGPTGSPVAYGLSVLPFGEGMLPPTLLQNHPIRFSREALEARVEGRAVVRCTITVEGNVENCRFLQRLPHMDEAILSALYMRKYSPATYQGKKISVDYNIPIRLKLP